MTLVECSDAWEPELAREKLNETLASEIGKIKCDCEHNSRISEHQRSSAMWKAFTLLLTMLFFLILWLAYMLGLGFGAFYAHSFATGGCYYSFFWNKDCEVAY